MPDLSILNTLIAMVIVILVLSLIVQSLQTLVKKFLKLKSKTLFNSLVDLFETIAQRPAAQKPAEADAADAAGEAGGDSPQTVLAKEVRDKFAEMGRKTLILGRPMLDSIAKGDLLKVLTRVQANNLMPGAVAKFQRVLDTVNALATELDKLAAAPLEGDASAKFAALQAALSPLMGDIKGLVLDGKNINPKVLLGDLYRVRQVKVADVLAILGEIQHKVESDLDAAKAAKDAPRVEALTGASNGLRNVATHITDLGKAFDAAFAPLREQLQQAEVWYDTVMQGFEERYTRHMRTVALVISVVVVIVLNANFFTVYQAMKNQDNAEAVIAQGESVQKLAEQVNGTRGGATTNPPANANTNANANAGANAGANVNADANATPAQTPPAGGTAKNEGTKKEEEQLKKGVDIYKSFGITPLTRQQVKNFFGGQYSLHDVSGTFLGWAIMVMLLTAGAPFWQDTLESLFGLKNLLRQKSNTKNVEGEKGGQTKP